MDTAALEVRALETEARLKDIPALEKSLSLPMKTHPEAQAAPREMDDAVETARSQIFFSNLPSVKDYRRQSKS